MISDHLDPRGGRWTVAVLCLLFFVTFYLEFPPFGFHPVRTGLDPSWQAALVYGIEHGLLYGTDIVFTAGPLSSCTTLPLNCE